jgi:transposase
MSNNPIEMSILRQIVQLKTAGKGIRAISTILGLSRNTVRKYLRLLEKEGLEMEGVVELEDSKLSGLVSRPEEADPDRHLVLLKLLPEYEKELQKTGVTRYLLWGEYRQNNPSGYNYSRFCYHFRQWLKQKAVTMHFEHKAGDKVFVDFTGKKLSIADKSSGEMREMEVFVAILGASQLTYVEALASQKREDFLGAMSNTFTFFGGVSKAIVPDNLKAAVSKANKYEALLNESFEDFGSYYGTTILPARSRKPRDKALVENAVGIIYSRIFAKLRKQVFFSLEGLNEAIMGALKQHNELPFQGESYSRRDRFEQIERAALGPLPLTPYALKSYAKAKVQTNSHVHLGADKHYYSVPFRYCSKQVKVVYTSHTVEVYYKHERIASHKRDRKRNAYTTLKDHMPSTHQYIADWNPDRFLKWGGEIGPETREYLAQVLKIKPYPEQAYRSCMGILAFATKTGIGKERLNKACARGLHFQSFGYQIIKRILAQRLDQIEIDPPAQLELPLHENIRGEDYYQ